MAPGSLPCAHKTRHSLPSLELSSCFYHQYHKVKSEPMIEARCKNFMDSKIYRLLREEKEGGREILQTHLPWSLLFSNSVYKFNACTRARCWKTVRIKLKYHPTCLLKKQLQCLLFQGLGYSNKRNEQSLSSHEVHTLLPGNFASQVTFGNSWRYFQLSQLGAGEDAVLTCTGQRTGKYETFYNAQESSQDNKFSGPVNNSSETKNS